MHRPQKHGSVEKIRGLQTEKPRNLRLEDNLGRKNAIVQAAPLK
jgi:hypothetical protein